MGFGNMKETGQSDSSGTSTSNSKVQLPDWVTNASKDLLGMVSKTASTPTPGYTGKMVADFTPDQLDAFSKIRDYVGQTQSQLPGALEGANAYASAAPQSVGTERVVDEGGKLGAMSDYINPYAGATLNPIMESIRRAQANAQKGIDASSTLAGAFGDSSHGIQRGALNDSTMRTTADATNSVFKDAFDRAMSHRTGDVNRFLETDKTNAGYNETALSRLFAGSGATIDRAGADQAQQMERLKTYLGSGAVQQEQAQNNLSSQYQEFLRKYSGNQDNMKLYSNILASLPYGKTITGSGTQQATATEKAPDNSGFEAIGSIAKVALPLLLSDRRAKRDITRVGATDDGLPVYRFRYLDSEAFQIGLMADDVEKVRPESVFTRPDGLKMVDYLTATGGAR